MTTLSYAVCFIIFHCLVVYDERFGVKKVLVCCVIFKCGHGVPGVGVFFLNQSGRSTTVCICVDQLVIRKRRSSVL